MSRTTLLSEVMTAPALVVGMPWAAGQQHPVYSATTMLPFDKVKAAKMGLLQQVMPLVDAYPCYRPQYSSRKISALSFVHSLPFVDSLHTGWHFTCSASSCIAAFANDMMAET